MANRIDRLRALADRGPMSTLQTAKAVGASKNSTWQVLQALKSEGLVRPLDETGPRRTTIWAITDAGRMAI